jgi:hypothetical protein
VNTCTIAKVPPEATNAATIAAPKAVLNAMHAVFPRLGNLGNSMLTHPFSALALDNELTRRKIHTARSIRASTASWSIYRQLMWPPQKTPSCIKEWVKEWIPITQAFITIAAVLVGGWWTYKVFIEQREQYPHANIDQKLSHVALSGRANVLRVGIELTNAGKTLLITGRTIIRVQQILPAACPEIGPCAAPLPPCPIVRCAADEVGIALGEVERREDRFPWLLIAERDYIFDSPYTIEPGEKQNLDFEFATPSEVKVVRVYAYFRNDIRTKETGEEIGWETSTYYDFRAITGGGTR